MGMDAELIAVGPYSSNIAEHLDYPAEDYKKVRPGTKVVATVVHCDTSRESEELANLLGVQAWDFMSHHISNKHARMLAKEFDDKPWDFWTHFEESWRSDAHSIKGRFCDLARAGFEFFYLPNG